MSTEEIDIERLRAKDVLTEEQLYYLNRRVELLVRAESCLETRAAIIRACTYGTADMPGYLYFFRYLANIFEPRNPPGMQLLPFVPYPYQVEGLQRIDLNIRRSMGVVGSKYIELSKKSRDMGETWKYLGYFGWDWLFNGGSFHLGSFKEDEVDKLGTHTTLFGKLRKMLYSLPDWLRPLDLFDKAFLLSHNNSESTITGESANEGFGRSKRVKGALMDELQDWEYAYEGFQSISNTCNYIALVGTPKGYGNFYGEVARKKKVPGAVVSTIHWTMHPLKTVDLEYENGKPTSSWYRDMCKKFPAEIVAAEIDLSFERSIKGPVFGDVYGLGHRKPGMKLVPDCPIIRCWDIGGAWSGVVLLQVDKLRRVRIYREVAELGLTLDQLVDRVLEVSEELVRTAMPKDAKGEWTDWGTFRDVGDPSGATISKANQVVPEYEDMYVKKGISVDCMQFATMPTDIRVRARILQIQNAMQRHIPSTNPEIDGPAFWIDTDACPTLDEAFLGGYRRKVDQAKNVLDIIEKNHPYNDVVDAAGYGIVDVLGVPDSLKRELKKKHEEQLEDEEPYGEYGEPTGRRSRC
jgi:hypothetical protein